MDPTDIVVITLHPITIALQAFGQAAALVSIELDDQIIHTSERMQPTPNTTWSLPDDQIPQFALKASSVLTINVFGPAMTLGLSLPIVHVRVGKMCITPISVIVDQSDATLAFPILDDSNAEVGKVQAHIRIHAAAQLLHAKIAATESPLHTSAQLLGKALVCFIAMRNKFFPVTATVPTKLQLAWILLSKLWRYHKNPQPRLARQPMVDAASPLQEGLQKAVRDPHTCAADDLLKQLHEFLSLVGFEVAFDLMRPQALEALPGLIDDTLREICKCALYLFNVKERHADLMYDNVLLELQKGSLSERQSSLFFLGFRWVLIAKNEAAFRGQFDRPKVVDVLVNRSIEELQASALPRRHDTKRLQSSARPFTKVLVSSLGFEAMEICNVLETILRNAASAARRNACRRAMARLVQRADRLPSSFYLSLDTARPLSQIGQGGFSHVLKGVWDKRVVAIKVPNNFSQACSNIEHRMQIYLEIITWRTLEHRYVLPFLGLTKQTALIGLNSVGMISPHLADGPLRRSALESTEVLKMNGKTVTYLDVGAGVWKDRLKVDDRKALCYLTEIAGGMTYLHGEGVVHGDLRGSNVFLEGGHVKIADFGLCVYSEGYSRNYFSMRSGNVRWAAPELIAPELYGQTAVEHAREVQLQETRVPLHGVMQSARPTKQSDVYSFGCLCAEIHDVSPLFAGRSDIQIIHAILRPVCARPSRPIDMLDCLWGLAEECWNDETALRPAFANVHETLQGWSNTFVGGARGNEEVHSKLS